MKGINDTTRVLMDRAKALAQAPEQAADRADLIELAAFHLSNERYSVPTNLVHEIQPLQGYSWSRVPCTPDFIFGLVNLRGHLYSIMDLARFLGLPNRPLSEKAHLLLVHGGRLPDGCRPQDCKEMELALLADDRPQVVSVSAGEINSPPSNLSPKAQEIVRGVTKELLSVLDLPRLLSDPRIIVQQEV